MNYEKDLSKLKEDLDKAKNLKYKAEARLEQLLQQEEEIIKEIISMGIQPDQLEEEIKRLTLEIEKLFQEAKDLLPTDIIEKK